MAVNPLVAGLKNDGCRSARRKLRRWSGASYFEAATRDGFLRVPVRVITGGVIRSRYRRDVMRELACHNGEIAFVDDEDFPLLRRYSWYMYGNANKLYPACFMWGRNGTRKHITLHQMIMGGTFNVDHIDRDVMNNQKQNLRPSTPQQNAWNACKRMVTCTGKPPSSQYKGVSKYTNTKGEILWAVIFILTKKGERPVRHFRKSGFKTEREAALFYNQEIVKHRGEYAYLNQVA